MKWRSSDVDFFLGSSEGYGLEEPRRCRVVADYVTDRGKEAVLVSVDPPITLTDAGATATRVVLVPRHDGETIRRPRSWPVAVHVALPRSHVSGKVLLTADLELFGWAEIYATERAARRGST